MTSPEQVDQGLDALANLSYNVFPPIRIISSLLDGLAESAIGEHNHDDDYDDAYNENSYQYDDNDSDIRQGIKKNLVDRKSQQSQQQYKFSRSQQGRLRTSVGKDSNSTSTKFESCFKSSTNESSSSQKDSNVVDTDQNTRIKNHHRRSKSLPNYMSTQQTKTRSTTSNSGDSQYQHSDDEQNATNRKYQFNRRKQYNKQRRRVGGRRVNTSFPDTSSGSDSSGSDSSDSDNEHPHQLNHQQAAHHRHDNYGKHPGPFTRFYNYWFNGPVDANGNPLSRTNFVRNCPFATQCRGCCTLRKDKKMTLAKAIRAKQYTDRFKDSFFTVKKGQPQQHITAVHSEAAQRASMELSKAIELLQPEFMTELHEASKRKDRKSKGYLGEYSESFTYSFWGWLGYH